MNKHEYQQKAENYAQEIFNYDAQDVRAYHALAIVYALFALAATIGDAAVLIAQVLRELVQAVRDHTRWTVDR